MFRSYGVSEQEENLHQSDDHLEQLRRDGFTILKSVLNDKQVHDLSEIFNKVYESCVTFFGYERLKRLNEHNTIRSPLLRERFFLNLVMNESLLSIVRKIMGRNFILNQQNGIINPSNEDYNQAFWHRDLPYQHFTSSRPMGVNALFCVDDFTEENGGTFVVPNSHSFDKCPSVGYIESHKKQITANAGDVLLMDVMLYHRGGMNKTKNARRAINHVFLPPIFSRQIAFRQDDFLYKLTPKETEVLGIGKNYSPVSILDFLQNREREE